MSGPSVPPLAVVTGASSGIGRATAIALARHGFTIGVGYRRDLAGAERTARAVADAGSRSLLFSLDQSDPETAADTINAVIDGLGGIGVFVNNAGVNRRSPVLEETAYDWDRVLRTDLTGPFLCAQTAARRMVAAGTAGRIINVTSVHETVAIPGGAAYCAAKAGLGLLTKVMALELAPHGITVNAIAPGETATPMNSVTDDVDATEINRPNIPVGRPGRAAEVGSLIAYLAGPDAGYLTGASLMVDGGLSLTAAVANQAHPEGTGTSPDPAAAYATPDTRRNQAMTTVRTAPQAATTPAATPEAAATPAAAPRSAAASGVPARRGIPTATNVDHIAYTVPDLDQAVEFFVEVLGADLLYQLDSVKDDETDWMARQLAVHPRACARIAMLRLGPVTNVELFQYDAPDQNRAIPKNSDVGGHHLAFFVEDIDLAVEYLRAQPGVTVLGDVQKIDDGPIAGDRWVYFLAPWGMQMEVLNMPPGMPYERDTPARRFGPCTHWASSSPHPG